MICTWAFFPHLCGTWRLRQSCGQKYPTQGRVLPSQGRDTVKVPLPPDPNVADSEDEMHSLLICPMTFPIKREVFSSYSNSEIRSMSIADLTTTSCTDATSIAHNIQIGKLTNSILDTYKAYTSYYETQDFHNNTGSCVLL